MQKKQEFTQVERSKYIKEMQQKHSNVQTMKRVIKTTKIILRGYWKDGEKEAEAEEEKDKG